MINKPIFHQTTKILLDNFLISPAQALILSGSSGVGKKYVANWISEQLSLKTTTVSVEDDKKMIGIEQIQRLYVQTRSSNKLGVLIADAHRMTQEAQNAFLKLLEEPTEGTIFILITDHTNKLLATILSRCQIIPIIAPATSVLKEHVTENYKDVDPAQLESLLKSAKNLPGRLYSLLQDDDAMKDHLQSIIDAKAFLSGSASDRLNLLSKNSFEQKWVASLVDNLALILETLLELNSKDSESIARISRQSKVIEATSDALLKSGNPKIHLTRLALEL